VRNNPPALQAELLKAHWGALAWAVVDSSGYTSSKPITPKTNSSPHSLELQHYWIPNIALGLT
jgi:hypothetical protein